MTVERYHKLDKARHDLEQANARYSGKPVGASQVWHRCAVLLGWRWEGGVWTTDSETVVLDEADTAKEACELSGVEDLRSACVLIKKICG